MTLQVVIAKYLINLMAGTILNHRNCVLKSVDPRITEQEKGETKICPLPAFLTVKLSQWSLLSRTQLRIFLFKRVSKPWLLPPNSWPNPQLLSHSRNFPFRERGLLKFPKAGNRPQKESSKASGHGPQTKQQLSAQPRQDTPMPAGSQSAKPPIGETHFGKQNSVQRERLSVTSDPSSSVSPKGSATSNVPSSQGGSGRQTLDYLHPLGGLSSGVREVAPHHSLHQWLHLLKTQERWRSSRKSLTPSSRKGLWNLTM